MLGSNPAPQLHSHYRITTSLAELSWYWYKRTKAMIVMAWGAQTPSGLRHCLRERKWTKTKDPRFAPRPGQSLKKWLLWPDRSQRRPSRATRRRKSTRRNVNRRKKRRRKMCRRRKSGKKKKSFRTSRKVWGREQKFFTMPVLISSGHNIQK